MEKEMCRMAAMSARYPISVKTFMTYFFLPLIPDNYNKDGWGIAYFVEREGLLIKECQNAQKSHLLRAILDRVELQSHQAILHVRRATKGRVTLANTHPFIRELWGMPWAFAHHGEVRDTTHWAPPDPRVFQPVGETDTEILFCWLLNALWRQFSDQAPPITEVVFWMNDLVKSERFVKEKFNFLLANPFILFAFYGGHHRMFWRTESASNPVAQVSSTPIYGHDSWQSFQSGELKVIKGGFIDGEL